MFFMLNTYWLMPGKRDEVGSGSPSHTSCRREGRKEPGARASREAREAIRKSMDIYKQC